MSDESTTPPGREMHLIVALLGLTQIVGYGTLYYSFAILAGDIGAAFGWSASAMLGVFSFALLVGGVLSPLSGRLMDRHGAAILMAAGSCVTAVAQALAALTGHVALFVALLVVTQVASGFCTYTAAFTCLTQIAGRDARRRITHLTLIAGFSSTLFWPITTRLHAVMGWREMFLWFALANLVICMPVHLWLARWQRASRDRPAPAAARTVAPTEIPLSGFSRRRALWLTTVGFALGSFLLSGVLAQMVPVLTAAGLGASAVMVGTLFGPAQVLVRFINLTAGAGRHPIGIAVLSAAMLPLASGILALTAPSLAGAVVFATLFGFGSGLKSIVQGALPLALFGRAGYGALLGRLAAAQLVASAVSPLVLAILVEHGGARLALTVLTIAGAAGFVALAAIRPLLPARG